jgi:hypothetical protein
LKLLSSIYDSRLSHTTALILRILFFLSIILNSQGSKAQLAGDYGQFLSGNWNVAANWKVYNGIDWPTSPVAASYPNNAAINAFILPGVTCTLTVSSTPVNNLTVNVAGKIFSNNMGTNTYLNIFGNITNDGVIGNGGVFDGMSFNIEGTNCLFSGTGPVDCSRIRKNTNTNSTSNLIIDINVNLRFNTASQTQIYNNSAGTTFNVTINPGKTLSLPAIGAFTGNASIDGLGGNGFGEMGGTWIINGTMIISGILYLTTDNGSSACTLSIGPTGVVQAANVIANSSAAGTHILNMATGGLFQITGTPFTNPFMLVNNNYNLSPASTIEYSAPGVQTVDSNLTYQYLKISGVSNKTGAGPIDVLGNFIITNATGAAVFVPYPTSPILNVGGDWINFGTAGFAEAGSFVTLNGSANQNVTVSAGGEDFATLRINKTAGKVYLANAPATIARVSVLLDLIRGNIVTSPITSSYYVQIQNTATVTNVSDLSFVEGACSRQAIAASPINFTFPVGKIAKYRPALIQGTPTTNSLMLCEYNKIDPNTVGNVTLKDPGLDHISRCEYWRIRNIGAASNQNYTVTLSWDTYSACNYGVTFLPDLRVASWGNPTINLWNDMGNAATTGTIAAGTVRASVVSNFLSSASGTPFTLASATLQNPLPIKLISFTAKPQNEKVVLNWTTASETNNDYFEVERSVDGIEFMSIARQRGAGNSTEINNYEDIDNHPLNGISYYRLKQTDYDGQFSYSDLVSVRFKSNNDLSVYAFPVPATDFINVYCEGKTGVYNIRVIQPDGRIIKTISSASSKTVIDLGDMLSGIYFLEVYENDINKTIRIIKK